MKSDSSEILIIAFDYNDFELLEAIERRVSEVFPNLSVRASFDSPLPLPASAYEADRQQYLTIPFLETLETLPVRATRVLGVTNVDIFAPGMLCVFGQARVSGRAGLISLARLRQEFYGRKSDRSLLVDRACKEAVHELGHTFGLDHCHIPKCVMLFSHCLEDTDCKGDDFCRKCSNQIYNLMRKARVRV